MLYSEAWNKYFQLLKFSFTSFYKHNRYKSTHLHISIDNISSHLIGMLRFATGLTFRRLCKMVDAKLEAVPNVDIEEGIFKYVLIKVYGQDESNHKKIVRGYADCEWHSDIYDRSSESCKGLGLETECLGGGRIEHNPDLKLIKVYGYSQGFGKADHAETKKILQQKFTDYEIEISDEGY